MKEIHSQTVTRTSLHISVRKSGTNPPHCKQTYQKPILHNQKIPKPSNDALQYPPGKATVGFGGDDIDGGAVAQIIVERVFGLGQWHVAATFDLSFTVAFWDQFISFKFPLWGIIVSCAVLCCAGSGVGLLQCCVDGVSHRYPVDAEAEVEIHGYLAGGRFSELV